ncbi:MAG: 4Fe-4S dicluster domain-containing protein [Chitinophagaceae bacterium]|jgi:heterodisulfide reductase subunit C
MHFLPQILFLIAFAIAIYLFAKRISGIRRNILLGLPEDLNDQPEKRWKNLFLLALGQKKMFKNPLVAFFHFIIYAGFIIINIEVLEILIDGLFGTHRLFNSYIPGLYTYLINIFEFLAAGVILVCLIFLFRRHLMHLWRFKHPDLKGWPSKDAFFILVTEIILMGLFLSMNATDTILQCKAYGHYADQITGNFIVSSLLHPLFIGFSNETLVIIERSAWWLHILGIFAFLNYLPWSKHLHIIIAFPNAYYSRLTPQGKLNNMPSVQNEVLYAFQPELAPTEATTGTNKFGASDIHELSWKNILDAYSCTECGRCSNACPASQTGKLLSPRSIMMKTRDRAEEIGKRLDNGVTASDGKSLLFDYITEEELRACTTCNACVEECPVSISPVDIIVQLRRYLVMEKSSAPQEWTMMFGNIENNFAPWKFSPTDRSKWIEG